MSNRYRFAGFFLRLAVHVYRVGVLSPHVPANKAHLEQLPGKETDAICEVAMEVRRVWVT